MKIYKIAEENKENEEPIEGIFPVDYDDTGEIDIYNGINEVERSSSINILRDLNKYPER